MNNESPAYHGPLHPDPEVHRLVRIFQGYVCQHTYRVGEDRPEQKYDGRWISNEDPKTIELAIEAGRLVRTNEGLLVPPPTNSDKPIPKFYINGTFGHSDKDDRRELCGIWQAVPKGSPADIRVKTSSQIAAARHLNHIFQD